MSVSTKGEDGGDDGNDKENLHEKEEECAFVGEDVNSNDDVDSDEDEGDGQGDNNRNVNVDEENEDEDENHENVENTKEVPIDCIVVAQVNLRNSRQHTGGEDCSNISDEDGIGTAFVVLSVPK